MGARIYIPALGRFTSVDPLEGGAANRYVYATDPVNTADINGQFLETVADIASIGYSAYQLYKDPSWGNGGLLAADTAATFVPFVPATGAFRAGSKGADKGSDLAKGARNWRQDKKISDKEARMLGDHAEIAEIKNKGKSASRDLYKDKKGNIYVKPKGGNGPGESTGLNINDY